MAMSNLALEPGGTSAATGVQAPSSMKTSDRGSYNCQPSEKFPGVHVWRDLFSMTAEISSTVACTRSWTFIDTASLIQPGRIAFAHRSTLAADGVDSIAAQVRRQFVTGDQMLHPLVFGLRLIAEWPGFKQRHLEAGIVEQKHNLAGRILAIMTRLRLLAGHTRPNVSGEKCRMIARQNRGDRAQRTDVRRGEHQVAIRQ